MRPYLIVWMICLALTGCASTDQTAMDSSPTIATGEQTPAANAVAPAPSDETAAAPESAPAADAAKPESADEETTPQTTEEETPDGIAGAYLASRAALQSADFAKSADYLRTALARDPKNNGLVERACMLSIMGGQMDRAIPLAEQWQQNKPNALLPSLVLFLQAAKQNNWIGAEQIASHMASGKGNRLTLPLLQAWVKIAQGQNDAANALLEPLFASPTSGGIIMLHAALMAEYQQDYTRAITLYEKAAARFTVLPLRLSMNMGNLYERTVQPEQAQKLYDEFIKRSPNNYVYDYAAQRIAKGLVAPANIRTVQDGIGQVMFDIATSFEGQASNELSVVYAQLSAYIQPDFTFNQMLLAELYEGYEQWPQAAKIYKSLLPDPAFAWSVGLRLARNYQKQNLDEKSIAVLEKMHSDFPKRVEPVSMMGDIYRAREDYAAAIASYSQAIENSEPIKPTDWPLFYARGTAFERAKLWNQAEKDLLRAIELSPDQPYVLNYLAYSWVERKQNLEQAMQMLNKAVELAPDDAYIIDSLGWAYYQTGEYAKAEPQLLRAVELRPFDPQLIDHYGDALWRLDQKEQAGIQWRRALSFNPDKDLQQKIQRKIEKGMSADATSPIAPAKPIESPQPASN